MLKVLLGDLEALKFLTDCLFVRWDVRKCVVINPGNENLENDGRDVWQPDEACNALLERAGKSFGEVLRFCAQKALVNDEVLLLDADFDGDHVSVVKESAGNSQSDHSAYQVDLMYFSLSLEGLPLVLGVVILMVVGKDDCDDKRDMILINGLNARRCEHPAQQTK